jgi:uncharacterized protein YerC
MKVVEINMILDSRASLQARSGCRNFLNEMFSCKMAASVAQRLPSGVSKVPVL